MQLGWWQTNCSNDSKIYECLSLPPQRSSSELSSTLEHIHSDHIHTNSIALDLSLPCSTGPSLTVNQWARFCPQWKRWIGNFVDSIQELPVLTIASAKHLFGILKSSSAFWSLVEFMSPCRWTVLSVPSFVDHQCHVPLAMNKQAEPPSPKGSG